MREDQRKALAALRFNWALTPDDVWGDAQFHVEGLHQYVEEAVLAGLRDAADSSGASPIGLVIQGRKGVGKTHLLGWVRQQVQQQGGYFFLVKLMEGDAFWANTANAYVEGLVRRGEAGSQLTDFLDRLAAEVGASTPTPDTLDEFVGAVRRHHRQVGTVCQNTLRALVLFASPDHLKSNIGDYYLSSMEETRPGEREVWGIRPEPKSADKIVTEISQLLALTGPSVIAVDQIDTLVALSADSTTAARDAQQSQLFARIADGLMTLRERTSRTLSLIACLPHTWTALRGTATDSFGDRFREELQLKAILKPELARELVEKRLRVTYQAIDFSPPHLTWPVGELAFHDLQPHTPRQLLKRIDEHARWCLRSDEARELTWFDQEPQQEPAPQPPSSDDLDALDTQFAKLREEADVTAPLDEHSEDEVMPGLLSAALTAWVAELGEGEQEWNLDPPPSVKPALHARLIRTLDEETDGQAHWTFRAIAAPHHRAALSRIEKARRAAGHHTGSERRKLVLLRNHPWSSGPKTQQTLAEFREAGGKSVPVTDEDLRTFAALKQMLEDQDPRLQAWLMARKPASETELLGAVLPTLFATISGDLVPAEEPAVDSSAIPLGKPLGGKAVSAELETLRMHTFIAAGSGSGKTVLIRRLVEECALRGVSAIVLDPNNDLARLGDAWPTEPGAWEPGDAAKAKTYLANTEVVVWTPNRQSGRPLSFRPLPDFAGVLDSPDDFRTAVDIAVAALAPNAGVSGTSNKAKKNLAVLREALRHYAQSGERDLVGLIDVMADLPDGVSTMANARAMAADMAETLKASMINDPLFGGAGAPADPEVLLTPSSGRSSRISVISFVGLELEEQRQSFVSQLQMELFTWVKRNPANDRPLGWLLVMDEAQNFAPSGRLTASTRSTLMLASQARKFGLGLVFATQAPKGLHNQVPGNATTHFYGRFNSPSHVKAADEMAQAKGSTVPDISRLGRGDFFVATDASGFQKVRMPMCLSHHPPTALTPDDVIDRARER